MESFKIDRNCLRNTVSEGSYFQTVLHLSLPHAFSIIAYEHNNEAIPYVGLFKQRKIVWGDRADRITRKALIGVLTFVGVPGIAIPSKLSQIINAARIVA